MKNLNILLVGSLILGFLTVPFLIPDNIRAALDAIKAKGVNSMAVKPPRQPPPCLNKPSSSSTIIVYRKSTGSTDGVEAAKVIVQNVISENQFDQLFFANTDAQGKVVLQAGTIIAFGRQRQRILAISPDGSDTTKINLVSCTGISEIKIPVELP